MGLIGCLNCEFWGWFEAIFWGWGVLGLLEAWYAANEVLEGAAGEVG